MQLRELSHEKCPEGRYIFAVPVSIDWMQINWMEKTSMCEDDDSRYFIPRFQNAVLRPAGSVRKDRDIAHIQVAAVNDEEMLAARGACTIELTSPMEVVMPGVPSCDLMEGGLGI
jgi:hypothetical protein